MVGASRAGRIRRAIGAMGIALVIVGGPVAGQASAAPLDSFSGMGTGFALRVTLDVRPLLEAVPALQGVLDTAWGSVPGQSGAFPGVIDQTFIKTESETDGTDHAARSVLAEGLIDLESIEATSIGQTVEKVVQNVQLPSSDLALLNGTVGTLKAAVQDGPGVNGSGKLTQLGVGLPLEGLDTDLVTQLTDELTALISDLTDDLTTNLTPLLEGTELAGIVDQLTGTIDGLTETLPADSPVLGGLVGGLGLPGVDDLSDPDAVTTALEGLLDVDAFVQNIVDQLNGSLLEGAFAELRGLVNFTKAAKSGDGNAVADSVAQLKSLNVLGGLIDVGLLNLESHSVAGGVKGSATNDSECSIADVKVGGDALAIEIDGSNIYVNGSPVPAVGDVVAQLKGVVDTVLETLGADVGLCETAIVEADPDGTAAAQRVSALRVEVSPLNLFTLTIDPTVETAVAAQVAVADEDDAPAPSLPRTGATQAATVLIGIGLAGGALVARKRFR